MTEQANEAGLRNRLAWNASHRILGEPIGRSGHFDEPGIFHVL